MGHLLWAEQLLLATLFSLELKQRVDHVRLRKSSLHFGNKHLNRCIVVHAMFQEVNELFKVTFI